MCSAVEDGDGDTNDNEADDPDEGGGEGARLRDLRAESVKSNKSIAFDM
jgi:hypothetical protein